MSNIEFYPQQIAAILKNLKSNSCGPDGIQPLILKNCSVAFAYPLYVLFTDSLNSSELPEDWKKSNVVPIYKKGCRYVPNNYRPISVTLIVVRCLERLIKPSIVKHLEDNKLLPHKDCVVELYLRQ